MLIIINVTVAHLSLSLFFQRNDFGDASYVLHLNLYLRVVVVVVVVVYSDPDPDLDRSSFRYERNRRRDPALPNAATRNHEKLDYENFNFQLLL